MITNDPDKRSFTLNLLMLVKKPDIEGARVGPFIVSPGERINVRVAQGAASKIAFAVHVNNGQAATVKEVKTEGEAVTLKMETVEAGRRYMFTGTTAANLGPGTYEGLARITTDSKDMPELNVKLLVVVDPAVTVNPKFLDFGTLPISSPDYDASRIGKFLFVGQARGAGLVIQKVSSDLPFIRAEIRPAAGDGAMHVLVGFDGAKLKPGSYTGKVILEFNNPLTPMVEIPVTVKAQ
ncbi:MAG: hypothetical protein ACKV2V_07740 [Blastocatellia bacterium]